VSIFDTGCVDFRHGILFFPASPAGGVDEQFAIPFFEVPRRGVCPVREFGEAVVRGNAATVAAQKSPASLAEEAKVFVFRVIAHDRPWRYANSLRGIAI